MHVINVSSVLLSFGSNTDKSVGSISNISVILLYAASTVQVSSHNSKVGEAVAVSITLPDGTNSYNGSITWDASKLQYVGDSCSGSIIFYFRPTIISNSNSF